MRCTIGLFFICGVMVAQAQVSPPATTSTAPVMPTSLFGHSQAYNDSVSHSKFNHVVQNAMSGSPRQMNAVGVRYFKGMGTDSNMALARVWFQRSADAGYAGGWYNLALMYKYGRGGEMNYEKAYQCFSKAAELHDARGYYGQGYMLYKGLGCEQNYEQAFTLFKQGAAAGKANCMYFLGLCFRNGYGVAANKDSSEYWLNLSAAKGFRMAKTELQIKDPENAELAGTLQDKIRAAQQISPTNSPNKYHRIGNSASGKEVEGDYTGYLLKYDWSGQHAVGANKLSVHLVYKNDSLSGMWSEDDSLKVEVHAQVTKDAVVFTNMEYFKKDHNNLVIPERLRFDKAQLQFLNDNGNGYLAGDLVMFSSNRSEPAKPMYVTLARKVKAADSTHTNPGSLSVIKAYPNPFSTTLTTEFEVKEGGYVQTQLLTLEGKIVYSNTAGVLEPGTYVLPIQPQQLTPGVYLLKVHCGNTEKITKVVKM